MKKFFAMILTAVLLLSLTACATDLLSGMNTAYVPSEDITVALTHVGDEAKVVTRRTSDKALSGVELVCVYFDEAGQQIQQYERVKCTISDQDKRSIWTFEAPAGCVYMDATIAAVTYADGTKHSCPGIVTWAKETAKSFVPANYETQATAAESCEAVQYAVETGEDNTQSLKLKNVSGKEITEVIACLLWFDAAGEPINVGGLLVDNSERVSAKELTMDEEAAYTVDMPDGAASAKVVIEEVIFADGSAWQNDYVYEWSVQNWKTAE